MASVVVGGAGAAEWRTQTTPWAPPTLPGSKLEMINCKYRPGIYQSVSNSFPPKTSRTLSIPAPNIDPMCVIVFHADVCFYFILPRLS